MTSCQSDNFNIVKRPRLVCFDMMMEDNNSHGTLRCGVTAACFIRQHDRSVWWGKDGEGLRQRRARGVVVRAK